MAKRKEGVCDSYCKGCVYNCYGTGDGYTICTDLIKTDKLRPCPAGTGCTVRLIGKKTSLWEYENNVAWERYKKERAEAKRKARLEKERLARMRTVTCPICGTVFQTTDARKNYCSRKCSNRAQYIRTEEYKRRVRNEAKA